MSETKLEPCPFCGGKAEYDTDLLPRPEIFSVWCADCKASIDGCNVGDVDIAAAWNTRADPSPAPAGVVAALMELVECSECFCADDNVVDSNACSVCNARAALSAAESGAGDVSEFERQKQRAHRAGYEAGRRDERQSAPALAEAQALAANLESMIVEVDDLIANSEGVCGLHLNGDVAPWSELVEGGEFEGWLNSLEPARRRLASFRAGESGETDKSRDEEGDAPDACTAAYKRGHGYGRQDGIEAAAKAVESARAELAESLNETFGADRKTSWQETFLLEAVARVRALASPDGEMG